MNKRGQKRKKNPPTVAQKRKKTIERIKEHRHAQTSAAIAARAAARLVGIENIPPIEDTQKVFRESGTQTILPLFEDAMTQIRCKSCRGYLLINKKKNE
jgi:hypothetical protein